MKKILLIFTLLTAVLYACKKEKTPITTYCYKDLSGFDIDTDSSLAFPFGTRNFWIYDDSIKRENDTQIKLISDKFLITPQQLFLIEDKFHSIKFNQWLPQVTLMNDTFYFTSLSENPDGNCYNYIPFIFHTDTFTYLNSEKTKSLKPENGVVNTKIGNLDYSMVYEESGGLKYYLHPGIGIIRIELRNDAKIIRSYTLNNYHIQ